jgi:hypothetical protein
MRRFRINDVNLDYLVKLVSANWCLPIFSTTVTIFPFVINIYLRKNTLKLCKYMVFLKFLPRNFQQSLIVLACSNYYYSDFCIYFIPLVFVNYNSFVRKSYSFYPIWFFVQLLFASLWIHENLFFSIGCNAILLYFILLIKFPFPVHLNNDDYLLCTKPCVYDSHI